jgi:xanthine/CO dehydrogenase XdhC/CoxF family maturation factor
VSGLICPIGVPGISSKLPGAIAIAIAAQLLQQGVAPTARGLSPAAHAETEAPSCAGGCSACAPERQTTT